MPRHHDGPRLLPETARAEAPVAVAPRHAGGVVGRIGAGVGEEERGVAQLPDQRPEGGEGGGRIVAEGSPETVARSRKSYTGQALRAVLEPRRQRRSA